MTDKKNPYHDIDAKTEIKIQNIIKGNFDQAALGTSSFDGFPMVSKMRVKFKPSGLTTMGVAASQALPLLLVNGVRASLSSFDNIP